MFVENTEHFETLVDLVRARAQAKGDARAFTYLTDGESAEINLSFAGLDRKARAVAAQLRQMAKPGDRVVLAYPPGLDGLIGFLGGMYAGMVVVPATPPRPNQPPGNLLAVMADSQASLLLTSSAGLLGVTPALAQMPACKGVTTDAIPDSLADHWKPPALTGDSLAVLQYTSGSTKAPRGVKMCQHHLIDGAANPMAPRPGPKGECPFVNWVPLTTTGPLFAAALDPIYEGELGVLMSPSDFIVKPVRWLKAMSKYRGTVGFAGNFAFQLCADRIPLEECEGLKLDSWGAVITSGELIRAASMEAFVRKFGAFGFRPDKFLCLYGLTESLSGASRHGAIATVTVDRSALARKEVVEAAPGAPGALNCVSNGHAHAEMKVLLVDPDTLVECGPGRVGEIWIQGYLVTDGYWNRPEETEATYQGYLASGAGPFLRTGDLGFMIEGELYIAGRLKDVIILHGKNIYAQDIEQTAEHSHPALQPAASAAFSLILKDEEHLAIVMEVKAGAANVDPEEVMRSVRRAIADEYQLPVHTVALIAPNTIPRTPQGKVKRYAVRDDLLKEYRA